MPEYISREAAIEAVIKCQKVYGFMDEGRKLMDVYDALVALPAADMVEVVRCRDCKHYNAGFECLIEGYGIERPADYFCADGKRKDGGQNDA